MQKLSRLAYFRKWEKYRRENPDSKMQLNLFVDAYDDVRRDKFAEFIKDNY